MVGTRRRIKRNKKKDGFIKKALKEICSWIFLLILMVLAAPFLCISAFVEEAAEIFSLFRRDK